jgi:hypothetical protein
MSVVNSMIKTASLRFGDFVKDLYGSEFEENLRRNIIDHFSNKLDEKIRFLDNFLDGTKLSIKRGKVWMSLSYYWTDSIERDVSMFWGNDVSVKRFPNEFESICRDGIIHDVLAEGPLEFNKDMAWEALSFGCTGLIEYIEKDIVERLGIGYLKDLDDIGLF